MELIKQQHFSGERSLFASNGLRIEDSVFENGESPLKESKHLSIDNCIFRWKYPLWYCHDVTMTHSTLIETARSGIWYTHGINISDSTIEAPKTFRRSSGIRLSGVTLPLAQETLWSCSDVTLEHVCARGDYFGMNATGVRANALRLTGNYCFDGGRDIELHDCTLISKDAFWNCENVTVYDSLIVGEYLGWNSKNITFINCTIESLQGLCYIDQLKLVNCKLINTTLAFEYSSTHAEIDSHIDSVFNPTCGVIRAKSIREITLDPARINPDATEIITQE